MFDLRTIKRLNQEESNREIKRMLDRLEGWVSPEALDILRKEMPGEYQRLVRLAGRLGGIVIRKGVM